jgi:hypothetical protein
MGFRFQMFRLRRTTGQNNGQVNQEKKLLDLNFNIGCCWVLYFIITPENVGWSAAGGETQQSLATAQPNLRKAMRNRIGLNTIFKVKFIRAGAAGRKRRV